MLNSDLISRAAAIEAVYYKPSYKMAIEVLKDLPAVDAALVRHGRWVDENPSDYTDVRMRCSVCRRIDTPLANWDYCPHCGAKMDDSSSTCGPDYCEIGGEDDADG